EVADQFKNSLVIESLQQVTEGGHFSAISEPVFDYKVIEVPAEGDFRYEFDIEVRPDFETPQWEGLELKRLAFNLTDEDVDRQTARTLSRFAPGDAVDGEAQLGDLLTLNIKFYENDELFSQSDEQQVALRTKLSFGDAIIENCGALLTGVKEGEKRETTITISDSAPNPEHRGKSLRAEFDVTEIRRIQINDLTPSLLSTLGFDSTDDLRGFVREELERQFVYHQHQDLRKQIVSKLTEGADWEMPESLVNKQTNRELQRLVLELQRSRFTRDQINQYVNVARNNARNSTIEALREHFVLEKIAEELKLEPSSEEYDAEIGLLAEQSDMSARRMRARLEKSGQMDAVRNQIIERQVIDKIAAAAKITEIQDQEFLKKDVESSSIDFLISGQVVAIPEAAHDNDAAAFPGAPKLPEADKKND
ncbi:MAG: trigger factor, partial [Pirellulaceae bacterium]|nr:trigger factor [Pirellulaceae bacterium]